MIASFFSGFFFLFGVGVVMNVFTFLLELILRAAAP